MKRLLMVSLALWFSIAVACARLQGAQEGSDSINGIWVGDFGPAFYDRNTISLELKWDGKKSDTPRRAGGLMSWAASKAVGA